MGGAFAGLADDATAAYANPAGLTILTRPEVSLEGRSAKFRLPLISAEPSRGAALLSNTAEDDPSVVSFQQLGSAGATLLTPLGAPDASGSTASFASVVLPRRHWTLALYRHQLVDLSARGARVLPPLEVVPPAPDAQGNIGTTRFVTTGSTEVEARLRVTGFGLAAARRLGERVSVGLTLVDNRASILSRRAGTGVDTDIRRGSVFTRFEQAVENTVASDDSTLTFNAGMLFRPREQWAVGLVVRQGPRFELGEVETRARAGTPAPFELEDFRVPDVVALGASARVGRRLLLLAEWSHVGYSSLPRPSRIPAALSVFTTSSIAGLGSTRFEDLGAFRIDDANEIRVGLELSLWQVRATPAIRLGLWHDPEHQLRFEAAARCPGVTARASDGYRCEDVLTAEAGRLDPRAIAESDRRITAATLAESLRLLFPPGKDRLHLTAGFGVVLGSRVQLDAAFDYVSSDQYTGSLSGVLRF